MRWLHPDPHAGPRPAAGTRGRAARWHVARTAGRALLPATVAIFWILAAPPRVLPAKAEGRGAVQLGDLAPAIDLDDLAGNRVSLGRSPGQTVVIQFFATWCEPCHRAWEDLLVVRGDPRPASVPRPRVVLVDLGESRDVVARWAGEAKLDDAVSVALDRNGTAAARFGADRLPTIFVVDAQGIVRHINRGWGEGYKARLRRWLSAPRGQAAAGSGVLH